MAARVAASLGLLQEVRRNNFAYLLIAPAGLLVLSVVVYPFLYAVEFSFHDSIGMALGNFVGLRNYRELLTSDVISNVVVSLIFVISSIALAVGGGLVLALILNQRVWFRSVARTIIFIPWVTSQIASALIWRWMLNADYGPVAYAMQRVGLHGVDFLSNSKLAMATLVFTNVWHSIAFSMIVILAAIQTLPESALRAAAVDGASSWRTFRFIVFPLLRPTILVCIIISSFSYFNMIVIPMILTGGGPGRATELVTLRMYQEAFQFFHLGFASTLTMLILALNIVLTFLYMKIPGTKASNA